MGYGGGAGGGIIVLGPSHNLFGATSGDAQENPLTVNPASNRSAAETVRDNYATANPTWLSQYNADDTLNIRLYFVESSENVIIHQFRQGSNWVDSNIVVAVQGIAGAALSYDAVSSYELPMVGASPDKDPAPSGLRRISSGTGAFESDETMMFPRESIQIGYAGVLSGVGALIRGRSFVTDRTYIIPFQYYDHTDGAERTSELSFPGPTEDIRQPVDTSTMSVTGSFNFTTTTNDLITDIKIKTTANASINNFRFRFTVDGSSEPYFYFPSKGKYDSGVGETVTADANGIIEMDVSEAPLLVPISINSLIEYAGSSGSLLGNGTIPYFAVDRSVFSFTTLARVDDLAAKENSLGNPSENGQSLVSTTGGVRSWVAKENALGDPSNNGYVLSSQTDGTRSWVDNEGSLGNPSENGQALVSTTTGVRSWIAKENALGDPGVNGYVLSSQTDGTRSWVNREGSLGNPGTSGFVLASTDAGVRSWVNKEDALGNPSGTGYVLASTTTGTRSWVDKENSLGNPSVNGQLLSSTTGGVRSWVNAPEDLGNPSTNGYVLASTTGGVRSWVNKENSLGNPATSGFVLASTDAGVRSWVNKENSLGNPATSGFVLASTDAGVRSWVNKENSLGNPSAMNQCLTSSTDGVRSWTSFEAGLGNPSTTGQLLTSTVAGVRSWVTSDANLGNPGTDGYLLSSTTAGVRSWVAPGEPALGNPSANSQILSSTTAGVRSWVTSDANLGNPGTDGYLLSSTTAGVRSWVAPGEPALGNPDTTGQVLSSTTGGVRSWATVEGDLGNPASDGQILSSTTGGTRSWITSDANLGNPSTDGQVLTSTAAGVRSWKNVEEDLGNPSVNGQLLSSTTGGVRSWITSDNNLGNPSSDGQVLSSTTGGVRSWVTREPSLGNPTTNDQVLASTTGGVRSWKTVEAGLGNPDESGKILSSSNTGVRSWIDPPEDLGNPSNENYLLSSTVSGTRSWVAPGEPVLGNPSVNGQLLSSTTGGVRSWVSSDANLGNPDTDGHLLSSTTAGVRSWVAPGEPVLGNPASDGQILSSTTGGSRSWIAAGEPALGSPSANGQILSSQTDGTRSWINVDVSLGNPATDGYVLSSTAAGVRSWIDPGEPDLGNPSSDNQFLSSTTSGVRSWADIPDNLGSPETDGYLLSSTTGGTRSWVAPGEPVLGNPASNGLFLQSTTGGVRSWAQVPPITQSMVLLDNNLTISSANVDTYNRVLIYTAEDEDTNITITINASLSIDYFDLAVLGTGDVTVSTSGSEEIDGGSSITYNMQRNAVRIKRVPGNNYVTIFSNIGSYVSSLTLSSNTLTIAQTGNAADVSEDLSSLIGEPSLNNPGTNGYLLSSTTGGTRSWVAPGEPSLGNPGTNGYLLSSTTGGSRSWVAPGEPSLGNPGTNNYVLASQTDGTRSWVAQTGESNAALVYVYDTIAARDSYYNTQDNRDTLFRGETFSHVRNDGNNNIIQQVWSGVDQPASYSASDWLTLNDNSLLTSSEIKTLYENNSNTNAFTDAYNTILSKLSYSSTTDNINSTANIYVDNEHNFKYGNGNTIIDFGRMMCLQRDSETNKVFHPLVIEIDTSTGNTVAARSYTLTSQTNHEIIGQSDPRAYLSGTLFSYVVTHTDNFFVTKLHFYTGDIAPANNVSLLIFRGSTNDAANLILSNSILSSAVTPNSKFTFTLDPVLEFEANQQYLIQVSSTSFIMEINSTENKFRYDVDRFLISASNVATESYVTTQLATKEDSLGNPTANDYVLSSQTNGTRSWVDPTTFLQSNTFLYRTFASETARDQYYNITANTHAMVQAQTTAFVTSTNTNETAAIYMWGGSTSPTTYDNTLWVKVDSLKGLTLDTGSNRRIESIEDIHINEGFYSYGLQNQIIDYGEKLALKRNSDSDNVHIPVTQTIDTTDYSTTDAESYSITNQVEQTIFAASVPASYTSEMSHTFIYTPTEDMYVTKFYFWCRTSGVTVNDEIEFTIYKGTSLTTANQITKTLQLYNIPNNSKFSFTLNETVRLLANQQYYIYLESVDNHEVEYNTTENKPRFSVDRGLITPNTLATQTWVNNTYDPNDVEITADVTISSANLATYNRATAYTSSTQSNSITVTLSENISVEYIDFMVQGTGNLTIATSGSETINDETSFVITDRNVGVRVKKIGSEYVVSLSSEDTRVTALNLTSGTLSLTQNNNEAAINRDITPILDRTLTEITANLTLANTHNRNVLYNSDSQSSNFTISIPESLTLKEFDVVTLGSGNIILDPGTNVTINGSTDNYTISEANSGVHFIKFGENYVSSLSNDQGSISTVSSLTLSNGTLTLVQSEASDVTEDITPVLDKTLTEITANVTLANTHNRNIFYNSSSQASNFTISIPESLTLKEFDVIVLGSGNIILDPGTNVTINGSTDNFTISEQNDGVHFQKIGEDYITSLSNIGGSVSSLTLSNGTLTLAQTDANDVTENLTPLLDRTLTEITANLTLANTHNRNIIYNGQSQSSNFTITIPQSLTLKEFDIVTLGSGNITLDPATNVTINGSTNNYVISNENAGVHFVKFGEDYITSASNVGSTVSSLTLTNGTLTLVQSGGSDVTEDITPVLDRPLTEITANITLANTHNRNVLYNSDSQSSNFTISIPESLTLKEFDVIVLGSGNIILDPGTNVTINGSTNNYSITEPNNGVHFQKIGEDYITSLSNISGSGSTVSSLTLSNGTLTLAQSGGSDVTEDLEPLVDKTLTEITANLTLANTHNRNILYNSSTQTGNFTISIPESLTIKEFDVVTLGNGNITIDPGTNVTINNSTDDFSITDRNVGVHFQKFGEDYQTTFTNIQNGVSSLTLDSSGTLTLDQIYGSDVTEDLTPLLNQTRTELTANLTLTNSHNRNLFYNSASQTNNYTITIPDELTLTEFDVVVLGTGNITLDPDTNVTINGSTDNFVISVQRQAVHIEKFVEDYVVTLRNGEPILGNPANDDGDSLNGLTSTSAGVRSWGDFLPASQPTIVISANLTNVTTSNYKDYNRHLVIVDYTDTNHRTFRIDPNVDIDFFDLIFLGTASVTLDPDNTEGIDGENLIVIQERFTMIRVKKYGSRYYSQNISRKATEPALGNPSTNGYVLASQTDGTRSWVQNAASTYGATSRHFSSTSDRDTHYTANLGDLVLGQTYTYISTNPALSSVWGGPTNPGSYDNNNWVALHGVDVMTDANVKTKYENNSNTNAFDNNYKTALDQFTYMSGSDTISMNANLHVPSDYTFSYGNQIEFIEYGQVAAYERKFDQDNIALPIYQTIYALNGTITNPEIITNSTYQINQEIVGSADPQEFNLSANQSYTLAPTYDAFVRSFRFYTGSTIPVSDVTFKLYHGTSATVNGKAIDDVVLAPGSFTANSAFTVTLPTVVKFESGKNYYMAFSTSTAFHLEENTSSNPRYDITRFLLTLAEVATTTQVNAKEDSLGNPASNNYVLASQTDGTRSWVSNAGETFGNPSSDGQVLSSTTGGTRSWVDREPALGNPGTDGYVLSSTTGGTRSWVNPGTITQTKSNLTDNTLQITSGNLATYNRQLIYTSSTDSNNKSVTIDASLSVEFIDFVLIGSGTLTINTSGSEKINGQSTFVFNEQYTGLRLRKITSTDFISEFTNVDTIVDTLSFDGSTLTLGQNNGRSDVTVALNNLELEYSEVAISSSVSITSEALYDQYKNKIVTVDGNTSGIVFTLPSLISRGTYVTGGDRFGLRHTGGGSNTVNFTCVTNQEDISDRTHSVTLNSGEAILIEVPESGVVYKNIKFVRNDDDKINQVREVTEFYVDADSEIAFDNGLNLHNQLSVGNGNVQGHIRSSVYATAPINLRFKRYNPQHDLAWINFWIIMVSGVPIPGGAPEQILDGIATSLTWIGTNITNAVNFQFNATEGNNTATTFTYISGNTIRITLQSPLDDIVTIGHSITIASASDTIHNGTFSIDALNSGNRTIDVTNTGISDSSHNLTGESAVFATPIYCDITAIDNDLRTVSFNVYKDENRNTAVIVNSNWFDLSYSGSESITNINYTNNLIIDSPAMDVEDISQDFYQVNSGSKKYVHLVDNTGGEYVGTRYLPLNHENIHIKTSSAASFYLDLDPADLPDGEIRRYSIHSVDTNSFSHVEVFAGRSGTDNQVLFDEGINGLHIFSGTTQVIEFYNNGDSSGVRMYSSYERTILSSRQDSTAVTATTGLQPLASSEISTVSGENEDPNNRYYSISGNKVQLKLNTEYEITYQEDIIFNDDEDTGPTFVNFTLRPQLSRSGETDSILYYATGNITDYIITLRNGNNSGSSKPTVSLNNRIIYRATANDSIGFVLSTSTFPSNYEIGDFQRQNRFFTIKVRGGKH